MKTFTAPQHIRSILPPIHPTKSIACTAWAVFFFFALDVSSRLCYYIAKIYLNFLSYILMHAP